MLLRAVNLQLPLGEELLQSGEELAAEDSTQRMNRQEESP